MTWHKDMNQGCKSGGRVLRLDYGSFYLRMYDVRMLYEHMCPYVIRRLHYVILLFRILPHCKVFCYLLTLRRYCIRLQEVVCVFYRIMRGREIYREKGEMGGRESDGREKEGERGSGVSNSQCLPGSALLSRGFNFSWRLEESFVI